MESGAVTPQKQTYFEATVTDVQKSENKSIATVEITSGKDKGKQLTVDILPDGKSNAIPYAEGDSVIILQIEGPTGTTTYITDYMRTDSLLILAALFLAVVVVVGRWHGILSVISMAYSFVIIGQFVLPNIVRGNDPVFIAILGGLLISPVAFYLSHGFNRKTTVALLGTAAALITTGILSVVFVSVAKLTGVTSDEALFVQQLINTKIDLRSLLLAGMIIGLLGVLDDITVSQAAIVAKLRKTNPSMSFKETFYHSMDIGKDHIASLVNTLVMVYAGAALPLFLLFFNSGLPMAQALSSEIVATEIVRTLVGSIGLVLSVPLTTLMACFAFKKP
ncbi:MAG: YibE/F family protein [Patescibacteria group bacterium]|nr:YibE/F family protein [Patescibacteria group bacterium]